MQYRSHSQSPARLGTDRIDLRFQLADIKGRISRAITKTQYEGINRTTFGAVTNYRILTFVNDLDSVAKRVEHIRSARSVADAQDINRPGLTDHDTKNAYPFDCTW